MSLHEEIHTQLPLRRVKVRKGTFSCLECKRRKKRCITDPRSGVCLFCQTTGKACIGQDEEEVPDDGELFLEDQLDRVENLVALYIKQRRQRQLRLCRQGLLPSPVTTLTGTGEDLTSRCRSLNGYFYTVLPHPFIASMIAFHGRSAYSELREPLKLSKTSDVAPDDEMIPVEIQPAFLARKLIRLAISLMYMESMESEEIDNLQLDASVAETASRYVNAARHLTSQNALLQSSAGLESLMMLGHYNVHLGQMRDAHLVFQRALHLALSLHVPGQPRSDGEQGRTYQHALQRLVSADRALSLLDAVPCVSMVDMGFDESATAVADPCKYLNSLHVKLWQMIVLRNVRMQKAYTSGENLRAVLATEYPGTLAIDSSLKQAMQFTPSAWWALPSSWPKDSQMGFEELNTSKEHYSTILLAHLPYILPVASGQYHMRDSTYCRTAAASASREVLARFPHYERFRFVPASFRALEQKTFLAGIVLLLAHMHGHLSAEMNWIEHERAKDLNLLFENVNCMERIFANDKNAPGSRCAYLLRALIDMEAEMLRGRRYRIETVPLNAVKFVEYEPILTIPIPYFGMLLFSRIGTRHVQVVNSSCELDLVDIDSLRGPGH